MALFLKKTFLITCLLVLLKANSQENFVQADSLINYGKTFLGVKYNWGQCSPKSGFDCSGFVYYVFEHFKVKVPRASLDYEKAGKIIKLDSCKKGDIIVFTGTNYKNRRPGHVGIIVSNINGEILFIHSSSGKKANGVIITSLTKSEFYKRRLIKIARLKIVQ